MNDLISIIWTDFLTPLDVKNEIQTKADYVKSLSTNDLVVAISNIASSSVGIWYDNGQPSANNPTLGITVPAYRGDVEGGLVGAVDGGIVGGVTAGPPGAVIGATAGAIIVGGSVSAYNCIVDSVC